MENVEPRRSLRLAKKKVTMGRLGKVDDPEVLPYCMAAVESGYAGTRQINPKVFSEEEDAPLQDISEQQELTEQETRRRPRSRPRRVSRSCGVVVPGTSWDVLLSHQMGDALGRRQDGWPGTPMAGQRPITGETQMTIQFIYWSFKWVVINNVAAYIN